MNYLHLIGGERWWWCGKCGERWAWSGLRVTLYIHDEGTYEYRCKCHPDNFKVFPNQAAVRAAYALGGLPAVHEIETKLYQEQLSTEELRSVVRWMFGVDP